MTITKKDNRLLFALILVLLTIAMAGCDSLPIPGANPTPTPEPFVDLGPDAISVTGEVVPADEATLSFATSGSLVELAVEVGDEIQAGDLIGRLDTTVLDAEISRAEAALAVAQANLVQVSTGARPQQIDEAEYNVSAANASVAVSVAQRDDLASLDLGAEIAQAEADVARAQTNYQRAQYHLRWVQNVEIRNTEEYDINWFEEQEIRKWDEAAQTDYNQALAALTAAQARLAELQEGVNEDELRAATAEVWATSAEYQAAVANLDNLKNGPLAEDIAVVEAQIEQAEARIAQARLAREKAELHAPFSGTVSQIYVRESQYINAGSPIVLVADLNGLHVETTDLNEIDVAQIAVGDTAIVTFDALPDLEIDGTVTLIAPKASEGAGVNYTATIELSSIPDNLRWGMTAYVDIPIE